MPVLLRSKMQQGGVRGVSTRFCVDVPPAVQPGHLILATLPDSHPLWCANQCRRVALI